MNNDKPASGKLFVDTNNLSCYSISNAESVNKCGRPDTRTSPDSAEPSASQAADIQKACVRDMAKPDILTLWKLWSETDRRLDSLAQCVREGVQVEEASNFSRWLRFSGLLAFLQPYEQEVPLPIRATELRRKCEDLIYECGEWYRLHERSNKPRDAYVSQSKLAGIESELREIKDALGLRLMATSDAVDTAETALRVLPGG